MKIAIRKPEFYERVLSVFIQKALSPSRYIYYALCVASCFPVALAHAVAGIDAANTADIERSAIAKRIVQIRPEIYEQGFTAHITADGKFKDYRAFRLLKPHRLVVDLPDVRAATQTMAFFDGPLVKRIRVRTLAEGKATILFDLAPIADLPYKVSSQDNQLTVVFGIEAPSATIESTRTIQKTPTANISANPELVEPESDLSIRATNAMTTSALTKKARKNPSSAVRPGTIFLHISSFRYKSNAEKEVQRLGKHGYRSFLSEEDVSGHRWFRVYIGSFKDKQEARRIGIEFKSTGLISYFRPTEADHPFNILGKVGHGDVGSKLKR